uniref:Uncharacterized protein n=1 Tax=Trypanosoma congolense (strain IL3000) TaxID=1068625 RepID=G0UW24_TRYCI|nr:conserved hypothetical protein [Trypanosoma congolense IL3000]
MSLQQDRVTDAMKGLIAQLERELGECRQRLHDSSLKEEELERSMETMQQEAHNVVSQWAKKTAELQEKLHECLLRLDAARNALSLSEEKNKQLEESLRKMETSSASYTQQINDLESANKEVTDKLAATERSLVFASQQIDTYESVMRETKSELERKDEMIQSLMQKENSFAAALSELTEDKRKVELSCSEVNSQIANLQGELTDYCRLLKEGEAISIITGEETESRTAILLAYGEALTGMLHDVFVYYVSERNTLNSSLREIEERCETLVKAEESLQTQLERAQQDMSSQWAQYNEEKEAMQQQMNLLEQDIKELQDTRINQQRVIDALQEELEASMAGCHVLESSKEGLEAELKAVKECYSTLLLEHNELRVCEQKGQQEAKARLLCIEEEKKILRNDYESRLQNEYMKYVNLNQILLVEQQEALLLRECCGRQSLIAQCIEAFVEAIHPCLHLFVTLSAGVYTQLQDSERNISSLNQIVSNSQLENASLLSRVAALEESLSLAQQSAGLFQSKADQLAIALQSEKENVEKTANENNVLTNKVQTMCKDMDEVDQLVVNALNNLREEGEKHQLEREKLTCEVNRYETLFKESKKNAESVKEKYSILIAENAAVSKALSLTENELTSVKAECTAFRDRERSFVEEKALLEREILKLKKDNESSESRIAALTEELRVSNAKRRMLDESSKREIETTKMQLHKYIEKYEDANIQVSRLSELLSEAKDAQNNLRETYQKVKTALEEAKQRCCNDALTIQKSVEERNRMAEERDTFVKKYNRVHDMLKLFKKESDNRAFDEIRKLTELCSQQEAELQQLRHQNITLKRGIVKLAENTNNQLGREKFVERLNLAEGQLRRPKKRSASDL